MPFRVQWPEGNYTPFNQPAFSFLKLGREECARVAGFSSCFLPAPAQRLPFAPEDGLGGQGPHLGCPGIATKCPDDGDVMLRE